VVGRGFLLISISSLANWVELILNLYLLCLLGDRRFGGLTSLFERRGEQAWDKRVSPGEELVTQFSDIDRERWKGDGIEMHRSHSIVGAENRSEEAPAKMQSQHIRFE
jgi:hypothetical protein